MSAEEEKKARYLNSLRPQADTVKSHANRTAEGECQYMLPTLLQMRGDNPKLKLLDVGCGPGSITLGLARYTPDGEATGLDLSDTVLEKARESATTEAVKNVKFEKGDIYNLPFEDGTFDIVHTHQTVCHMQEPVRAIKELVRVAKKGGVVCMREGDTHTARVYPPNKILDESWSMLIACFSANGTVTDAGIRLKHWTVEAGVPRENITATAGTWCHNTPEQREAFGGPLPGRVTKGPIAEKAVEIGFCTKERLQEYAEAWRQWVEDEDSIFCLMHGQVIARI